jgi:hypothetical protein
VIQVSGHKARPYLKNNQHTKGWRHGRAPALQVGGPEFNTPVLPLKKKEEEKKKSVSFVF